ncbi:MAG: DUF3107 domain-containing protein [Nocardioides sp.]
MEVKIGIQYAPRELVVETDESAETVEKLLADAVAADGILALSDAKGRRVIVPASKVAYLELGTNALGTVGFRH